MRPHAMPFGEFVALMGTMTALIALSIDMMLPALPAIAATLGVQRANDSQLIVSLLFLGSASASSSTDRFRRAWGGSRPSTSAWRCFPRGVCWLLPREVFL
jgi:hypothetical protein